LIGFGARSEDGDEDFSSSRALPVEPSRIAAKTRLWDTHDIGQALSHAVADRLIGAGEAQRHMNKRIASAGPTSQRIRELRPPRLEPQAPLVAQPARDAVVNQANRLNDRACAGRKSASPRRLGRAIVIRGQLPLVVQKIG